MTGVELTHLMLDLADAGQTGSFLHHLQNVLVF